MGMLANRRFQANCNLKSDKANRPFSATQEKTLDRLLLFEWVVDVLRE